MATKRILMVLTSHDRMGDGKEKTGWYLTEAAHPFLVFAQAGFQVDFASPKGGEAPMEAPSEGQDEETLKAVADDRFIQGVRHTKKLAECRAADYDGVYFVGGHGTMWDFAGNAEVQKLVEDLWNKGAVVAAVCHGPAALLDARTPGGQPLVAGKQVSSFTNEEEILVGRANKIPFKLEDSLKALGAQHVQALPMMKKVAVSGRLVTGQNPASATGVAEAAVDLLRDLPAGEAVPDKTGRRSDGGWRSSADAEFIEEMPNSAEPTSKR